MEIKLITIGNLKEDYLLLMQNDYLKRLSNYVKVEIIEVAEEKVDKNSNINLILEKEYQKVVKKISEVDYIILLDLHGEAIDSLKFASFIEKKMIYGTTKLTFVIGGSYGVAENLRERADYAISLSKLTFTHQFTRIILLEQIYRSFKIINHETYHK